MSTNSIESYEILVEKLERIRFQLQLAEARVRADNPSMADLLADLADETDSSLEKLCGLY
ncbi:MAG: hypothetical protein GY768_00625 [Planctomycetaceae bacterium]|nr:hypothetical protein [Planctomycetaceae bacterium]